MKNDLSIFYPDKKSVLFFIKNFNKIFNQKLTKNFAFPRVVSLSEFNRLINYLGLCKFPKVAVISGSVDEPELNLINYDQSFFLQFDAFSNSYNLDEDWELNNKSKIILSQSLAKKEEYDLVLCNQVLEHIFSPTLALKNIYYLLKKGGHAWISVPTINCIHGDPYFYSAGYHPRYINRICKQTGFEVLHIGAWGNRKYLAYAVQGHWLVHDELKVGFRSKLDLAHPYFAIQDGRKNDTRGSFITDTWALIKKN
jgi:SAM-dependent methyltransferase